MAEYPELTTEKHIELLEKRLAREKNARKQAELILNEKARELYETNVALLASEELLKESLSEQSKLLIQAQEIARIGSFKWDLNHDRFYGSEFFWTLLKINVAIDVPQNVLKFMLKSSDQKSYASILYLLRTILGEDHRGDVCEYKEVLTLTLDDEKHIFISRLQVVYDMDGRPRQILGIIQDITRSKLLEQQLLDNQDLLENRVNQLEILQAELSVANEMSLNEAERKTEFMSTVSHELRTPLTSIHASLGLVLNTMDEALPESMKNVMDIAYRNSNRLKNLVDDVLDVEKFEAGKLDFNLSHYKLEALIEESVELNKGYVEKYAVMLSMEKLKSPCTVFVDSERFQQVMSNLISNAAKHSPAGSTIYIDNTFEGIKDGKGFVNISVQDSGVGIPEGFHNAIFDKFTQASKDDKHSTDGTGLGLFLTKEFVERLQGDISFVSKVGEGTTFYVTLPCLEE
jgi:signal transduction histidine kinase